MAFTRFSCILLVLLGERGAGTQQRHAWQYAHADAALQLHTAPASVKMTLLRVMPNTGVSAAGSAAAARTLKQDPATFVSSRGHQPIGVYAVGEWSAAATAGTSIGVRYAPCELAR